jgi:hypothetical protein
MFLQVSHIIWRGYVLSHVRILKMEADQVSETFHFNHLKQVLAQQGYVKFSHNEIFRTPF